MRLFIVFLALVLSCSAPQPPGSGAYTPVSWVNTAETGVAILTTALPAAVAIVQILPIEPQAKMGIIAGFHSAEQSLPEISVALERYRRDPSASNECAARAVIKLTVGLLLAVGDGLAAVGFDAPAMVLVTLGGLGSLVDELLPVCEADGGTNMSHEIESHLSRRPLNLRSFPRSL